MGSLRPSIKNRGVIVAELALYRQLRPRCFADVVGQDATIRALRNQVQSGKPSHAYLFSGPRGTGKTSTARILARALNCQDPKDGEACNQCPACLLMAQETVSDILEIDAASNNGVDEIRELREQIRYAPLALPRKVYIIDEVHMLSPGAFNALLKTLEEPPAHAVLMMATTEIHKLPATILSRCQRYALRRIPLELLQNGVRQAVALRGGQITGEAAALLARAADGAMRDALSLAEQALVSCPMPIDVHGVADLLGGADPERMAAWMDALLARDTQGALGLLQELLLAGRDPGVLTTDLAAHVRGVLMAGCAPDVVAAESPELAATYLKQAKGASLDELCRFLDALLLAEADMRWHVQPLSVLELCLARCCIGEVSGRGEVVGVGSGLGAASGASGGFDAGVAPGAGGGFGADPRLLARLEALEHRLKQLEGRGSAAAAGAPPSVQASPASVSREASAYVPLPPPAFGEPPATTGDEPANFGDAPLDFDAASAPAQRAQTPTLTRAPSSSQTPALAQGPASAQSAQVPNSGSAPGPAQNTATQAVPSPDQLVAPTPGHPPAGPRQSPSPGLEGLGAAIRQQKQLLYAAISAGRFCDLRGDALTLSFPPDQSMSAAFVQRDKTAAELGEILQGYFGRPMQLSVNVGEPPPDTTPQNNLADAVAELFGRENLTVE